MDGQMNGPTDGRTQKAEEQNGAAEQNGGGAECMNSQTDAGTSRNLVRNLSYWLLILSILIVLLFLLHFFLLLSCCFEMLLRLTILILALLILTLLFSPKQGQVGQYGAPGGSNERMLYPTNRPTDRPTNRPTDGHDLL